MGAIKNKLFEVIFRDKPAEMLLALKDSDKEIYASIVAKRTDCTYSHVVKILKVFLENKLIEEKKNGRLKLLILTKKGRKIAECIDEIKKQV